ncbi:hypothetical protein DdX_21128 [Ditylenchus destructor]|uniref:Uncharacterized protein n=1 Tax=Ditylenchus destructor TaxID=166010 RepID=A0AAD4QW00_9BILA|nr:hypothetical protein DdX_21128 [Ditylenchus destructor]
MHIRRLLARGLVASWVVDRKGGDAEVGPLLQDAFLQRFVREAVEVDLHVGHRVAQLRDRQGHQRLPDARARENAQQGAPPQREIVREAADALHAAIDLLDFQIQAPRLRRRMQAALHPFEQQEAEPALGMRKQRLTAEWKRGAGVPRRSPSR